MIRRHLEYAAIYIYIIYIYIHLYIYVCMSGYTSAAALARPETRGYIKIHGECGRKK